MQPIEKSTAGASVLAQVIVSKFADHLPLYRQERIFQRHGVEISRKTMGGWLPPVAELLDPLYQAAKMVLFESKVIGTDDTGVKVLDPKLPFALRTQFPLLELEDSLTAFVKRTLGLDPKGRNIRVVKDQLTRLASADLRFGMGSKDGRSVTIKGQHH